MPQIVYINLPVESGARSRAFYEALGFSVVPQFTNDRSICICVSDVIYLMLLEREVFAGFAPGPVADPATQTGVLVALSRDSREAVDAIVEAAVAHGGSDTGKTQEFGDFMYGRTFRDPDGNVFEPGWMDMEKMQAAMAAQKG
ncbi:VOC family protein [Limimaricola variabilis]|uniref:VOC family protein n=1 Tax=Limimaricola variabilis TaxID=1492771 RepID=UPI002AC9A360|nr:VOC family protein [Limimaricola variabilis]WPY94494.1 VOC family protein [Limimaricola variabilis]